MSWRIRWLVFSPVLLFVAGVLLMSCSGGSSSSSTTTTRTELTELSMYLGSPAAPTPTVSPTKGKSATPTPTMTLRPTPAPPLIVPSAGATIQFGVQGVFQKSNGSKPFVNDLTNSSIFTSDNPDSLLPPAAQPGASPGVYTGASPGCACVQASNSGMVTNQSIVGVMQICTACPTPSMGAAPTAAALQADSVANASTPDNAGILMWTFDAGANLAGQIAPGADGSIYFITTDGVLHAINNSGKEVFRRSASGASPIVTSSGLVAYLNNSDLDAIKPDGSLAWHVAVGSGSGPLATSGDAIYVLTSKGLSSVSIAGQVNWTIQAGSVGALAATADGVVTAAPRNAMTAFATDGASSWTFLPTGGFAGGLAVQGDVVYAGSSNGTVYAIEAGSGKEMWHLALPAPITAGPTLNDGGTIFVTAQAIYAISSSGQILWQQNGSPTASGPIVAVGAQDVFDAAADSLAVVLGADGSYVWSSRSFGTITTAASAGDLVYVASDNGHVYAVR